MPRRKICLVNGQFYHVFNKSIVGFTIFNHENDYSRYKQLLFYYQYENRESFSRFIARNVTKHETFESSFNQRIPSLRKAVSLTAYCLMPTHIHLLLLQNTTDGIENFMQRVSNGYSKYFNVLHRRKGPLWESGFGAVPCESNEQLLHLTRYIHLNPTTAYLVSAPEEWAHSSYHEYLSNNENLCAFKNLKIIPPSKTYQMFVESYIEGQRAQAKTKKTGV